MADGVTYQALERLSHMPDNPSNPADAIAGQKYFDVDFTGGSITGITPSDLPTPLDISDGGTGQVTANAALNALLPTQTGQSGKALKTNGTNTSWSSDIDTGITQLTGDVTAGPGSGSQAATLATVNGNVGSFGSSTSIPSFTVNAKGLITAASGNAVVAPAGTLTGTTLASGVVTSSITTVGTIATGVWHGTKIGLLYGGTNSDLSGTGGTSQVLKQTSVGGNVTVAQLAASDLSNGTTGSGAVALATSPSFTTPALGTPSSGVLTNCTGTASGLTAGNVTTNANLTGLVTSVGNATTLNLAPITNSLGADVNLNNTGLFFDGPSIAQGSTGTWYVSGTVTVTDTTGAAIFLAKLWDGTTTIASAYTTSTGANNNTVISLSGYLASPAGNLRISVRDGSTTSGKIIFNQTSLGKDSTISAFRIA